MKIEWKDIWGYEGYYQVSNTGQVRSLPRCTSVKGVTRRNGVTRDEIWARNGKIFKPINMRGTSVVRLYREGQPRKTVSIRKLVKFYFVDVTGHVAIVEKINKDSSILVSQNRYNK